MHRLRPDNGLVTGDRCHTAARASATQRQQAILHLLHERLMPPRPELSARREHPLHTAGVPGQFDKINRLMQDYGRLLRLALANEGGRQVPKDHRLVLLLAHAEALCRLLEGCLRPLGIMQAEMADPMNPPSCSLPNTP
jgi:hypothetical protein